MKRKILVGAVMAAIAIGCNGGGASDALRTDCLQVRDKAAQFAAEKSARGRTDKHFERELAKHRENLAAALGETFLKKCESQGDSYVQCALKASSRGQWEACK